MDQPKIYWDAGEMGCGELIIKLKKKISSLAQSELIEVRALDQGAIEDIPSWCRMTKNILITNQHPIYIIKKG